MNILLFKCVGNCAIKSLKKLLRMWNGIKVILVGLIRVIVRNSKNYKRYSIEFVVIRESFILFIGVRAV